MKNLMHKQKFLLLLLGWLIPFGLLAQEVTITGNVTDAADGSELPGVTIVVKGTAQGTISTPEGTYNIKANVGDVLVYSFVGFNTEERTVTAGVFKMDVAMNTNVIGMDEVVVIGYGVQQKREIIGSITKVNGSELSSKIAPSIESTLSGIATGVSVTTGSGMAGSGASVRVRGVASINSGGDPLYVVNGIPITNDIFGLGGRTGGMNVNPLSSINPNDIESVEILKDASATGIYGSRGANGVIIITTKRAKEGKMSFDFSTKQSFSTPSKKVNMTNSSQWLDLYQEAWENDGNTGVPTGLPGGMTWETAQLYDTDWWDLVTRTGFKQEYNLAVNLSPVEKLFARIGGSYTNDNSYLEDNSLERITGMLNLDYKPNNKWNVALSSNLSNTETALPGNPWDGGLGAAMGYALPIYPVKNTDGTYFKGGGNSANPVMVNDLRNEFNKETRSISSLSVNVNPLTNLSVSLSGALDYLKFSNNGEEQGYLRSSGLPYTWENTREVLNWNYTLVGSYTFDLGEKHDLKAMLGHELQESITTGQNQNRDESRVGDEKINVTKQADQQWRFVSFFGRLNYLYNNRYIAQGTLRTDGSSRFGKNKKYGYFPTVALGWIISEEEFLKTSSIINFMKLKASFGITGNSNIPNYEPIGTYALSSSDDQMYNSLPIRYPQKYANPDLKWETTKSYDLGLEAKFLKGRIGTELAYFYKNTEDVFINVAITATSGYGSQWQNLATIENEGFEFALNTKNFDGDFKWYTDFNISTLRNEVTDLGGLTTEEIGGGTNDTRILLGYPVGTNRLVRVSRIDPTDGRPVYLDKEGNETKTYKFEGEEGYAVAAGKVLPDFTGGLTNTFSYKGFEVSALFTFSYGADVYDSSSKRQMGLASDWNFRTDIFDRWRQPGDIAKYPRMSREGATYGKDGEQWFNSTMWLFDGSYMRLKNLTIAYNFPHELAQKLNLSSAKVYFSGTNLLTFTNYPGADPEVARDTDDARDRNMSSNVSFLTPPQEKVFTFGVNVSF